MNRLIFWFLTSFYAQICCCFNVSTIISENNINKFNDHSAICDTPPSLNIDPEKCCKFPKVFNESIVMTCEDESKGVSGFNKGGDLISDSCVIECMFNKSMNSKLHREGMLSLVLNNIKSADDGIWNKSLIMRAIESCFNEFTDDDMSDIIENIKKEIGSNSKSIAIKICNPKTSFILDCFYRELFKVCPKEKFANDLLECKVLKNYTNLCDDW